ncbi:hypothetical protein ACIHDR_09105 [Nocardia sp. NPDC052278]|uniref:hypothetical protein n=1 Tax=unclassified Nocardia TaxID=2637762 RepID=UPI003691A98C
MLDRCERPQFADYIGTGRHVHDFAVSRRGQVSHCRSDFRALADHRGDIDVLEQQAIAVGKVGEVTLECRTNGGIGDMPVDDPAGPIASRTRFDPRSSPVSSTVPETVMAVGKVGWTGPMTPSATEVAGSAPRGPKALSHNGVSIGRGAASPVVCSIRAG